MTEPPFAVLQESDRLRMRSLLLLAAVSLLGGGLAVFVAALLAGHAENSGSPRRAPAQLGLAEQTPIETTERGLSLRKAQQRKLEQYGWVDRDAGLARIPIERAMDQVLREK